MNPQYSPEDRALLRRVGNNIRDLRKKASISQEELADLARIDRSYLGGVERGERNISAINIRKIAGALRIGLPKILA